MIGRLPAWMLLPALAGILSFTPSLPPSRLQVRLGEEWVELWDAARAPTRWSAPDPRLERAVQWHDAAPGLEWGEAELAGEGEAWRTRLVVVQLDPARYRLSVSLALDARMKPAWTVDSAAPESRVAVNAGHFSQALPWGWVVEDGRELMAPGEGPLAMAVVMDSAGMLRLVASDSIAATRDAGAVVTAFESYPALLVGDGQVPEPLRESGRGVDLEHRDGRVALGVTRDGRLLIALTRFDGLGGVLDAAPLGLTVPELAALMGALGCRRAVALDGGLSGQLLVRDTDGSAHAWRGWRRVPLGLVAMPRATEQTP